MLKKNCHKVFGSQKSKLTVLERDLETAGAIPPSHPGDRVNGNTFNSHIVKIHTLQLNIHSIQALSKSSVGVEFYCWGPFAKEL